MVIGVVSGMIEDCRGTVRWLPGLIDDVREVWIATRLCPGCARGVSMVSEHLVVVAGNSRERVAGAGSRIWIRVSG